MGLEVPERGVYLRALLCEDGAHPQPYALVGVLAMSMGFDTVFMYAWRDREIVLDMMEDLSGGRVSTVNVIGGVRIDLDEEQRKDMLARLALSSSRCIEPRTWSSTNVV